MIAIQLLTKHWVYVPDKSIVFHKYAWISNYSQENAPRGRSTLLAEITLHPNIRVDIEELKDKVMVDFENINVISKREDVLFIKAWLHEYGYPIHVLGNRKKRKKFYNGWKNKTLYQLEDGAAGNTGIWIKYTKKYWP
jgi:protoporphyrinogen oxidase